VHSESNLRVLTLYIFFFTTKENKVGAYFGVANYDDVFADIPADRRILINNLESESEEQREQLNDLIYSKHEGNVMSVVPRCKCGELEAAHHLGTICEVCGTVVKEVTEDIEPIMWLSTPVGLRKMIHPLFLAILRNELKQSHFDILHWMCDTRYVEPNTRPEVVVALEEFMRSHNIFRTYNSFVDNYDQLISFVRSYKRKKGQDEDLEDFMGQFKDLLFVNHIPLPNRSILILESTPLGGFSDPTTPMAVDAIRMLIGIDKKYVVSANSNKVTQALRHKQDRFIRGMIKLADYYEKYAKTNVFPKRGIIRKHELGSRVPFCGRAVVSSNTDVHDYRCIQIPWGVGVTVFRYHLMNKLRKLGYTYRERNAMLNRYALEYSELIDSLFKELISECKNGIGVPVSFHRNPTLERGSAQLVYIDQVIPDVDINTIIMSILIVRGFNADFDGDAMHFQFIIDEQMEIAMAPMAPHKSAMDLEHAHQVSGNLALSKPVTSMLDNWLFHQ
jgi:hypothetical protein